MKRRLVIGAGIALIAAAAVVVVAWQSCRGSGGPAAKAVARTTATPERGGRGDPRTQALASIAGTVTDVAGAPIGNARVCASGSQRELSRKLTREPRCTTSDDHGVYAITGLFPIRHDVSAMARPYVPRTLGHGIGLRPGEHLTGVDLVLYGTGVEVAGIVVDITGGSVAHAMVRVDSSPPVEADDAGRFTLWTAPGLVHATATADGYADGGGDGSAPGELAITLTPESSISGIVVDAETDAPVAGATVTVGTGATPADLTDADGRFRVDRLQPGRYSIAATQRGRFGVSEGALLVGLAQHLDGVEVRMFPVARVEGRVMIAGAPARPCPESLLILSTPRGNHELSGRGAADGSVHIDAVVPGTYDAGVACDGDYISPERARLVVGDVDISGLTWEVAVATSTIRGRVLDARGALVRGARVRGFGHHDVSGSDGRYEISGLPSIPDELYVVASAGVAPASGFRVDVAPGTTGVVEKDLVLEDAGRIEGTVVDTTGNPVEHVHVGAVVEDAAHGGGGQAWTGRDGRFAIDGLRAATYNVRTGDIDMSGVAGATVEVRATKVATVRLVVESRAGTIRGTVRDGSGNAITDAFVSAVREEPDFPSLVTARWNHRGQAVVTDVDGAFVIDKLPAGTFTLYAARRGGGEGFVEHVAIGATVDIRIKATGTIEGTVRAREGLGHELHVSVLDSSTRLSRVDRFYRTDGRYVIRDLPAGRYTVTAQTGGRRGIQHVELAEAQQATGVDIDLDGGASVRGRVIDPVANQPIAGATIRAGADDGYPYQLERLGTAPPDVISDADGRFQIDHVPEGELRIEGDVLHRGAGGFAITRMIAGTATVELGDVCVRRAAADSRIGVTWRRSPGSGEPSFEVDAIDPTGPAAQAGLKVGDAVVAINGIAVAGDGAQCGRALLSAPPGTRLALGLARGETVTVTLAPRPAP